MRYIESRLSNQVTHLISNLLKRVVTPLILLLMLFSFTACDSIFSSDDEEPERTVAWEQTFNQNTEGWITNATSGQQGWCGSISQFASNEGPVSSLAQSGYAAAMGGPCNSYWQDQGFPASAPYSPAGGFSSTWPENGFANELDIYLDPQWEAGSGFGFSVSALNQDGSHLSSDSHSGYFVFQVSADNSTGSLLVGSSTQTVFTSPQNLESGKHFTVNESGWYTFRHEFFNSGGNLSVDLQLLKNGSVVYEERYNTSFSITEEVGGNEYAWFTFISDGLNLPIDEHKFLK